MPKGLTECPICHGSGRVTESLDYEFVTRDPETSRCLICDGSGHVHPGKKLANGVRVASLNVSRKHIKDRKPVDIGIDTSVPKEPYEKPMFLEMATNKRLTMALASGKYFLIVTASEPYYITVFKLIREQEKRAGTWTEADEEEYVQALEDQIKRLQEVANG